MNKQDLVLMAGSTKTHTSQLEPGDGALITLDDGSFQSVLVVAVDPHGGVSVVPTASLMNFSKDGVPQDGEVYDSQGVARLMSLSEDGEEIPSYYTYCLE